MREGQRESEREKEIAFWLQPSDMASHTAHLSYTAYDHSIFFHLHQDLLKLLLLVLVYLAISAHQTLISLGARAI